MSEATGPRAPDGSWVELYLRLPSFGEAEIIDAAIAPRSTILELGAGVGRVTHDLVARGHQVVAVDQSAEMLKHVRGAEAVLADIETLDLARTFDTVVLASNLINVPDDHLRNRFLQTCARHLNDAGSLLIQRYEPDWDPKDGLQGEHDGVNVFLRDVSKDGAIVRGRVEYQSGNESWQQIFVGRLLTDEDLAEMVGTIGLVFDRRLDSAGTWVQARRPLGETSKSSG